MEKLVLFGGTFLICCIGTGIFHLASAELEEAFPRKNCLLMILVNAGLLAALCFGYQASAVPTLKCLALAAVLSVCAWSDFRKYLILNRVLLAAVLLRAFFLAAEFFTYEQAVFTFILKSAGIAAVMFLIGGLLCKAVMPKGVGFGDIKLLFVTGLFTGADFGIQAIFDTCLVMFAGCLFLLLTKRVTRKSMIPFAPFLYVGTVLAALFGGV